MEEAQIHISDVSHVTPLSENYSVHLKETFLQSGPLQRDSLDYWKKKWKIIHQL
jgi:hypothetical protein